MPVPSPSCHLCCRWEGDLTTRSWFYRFAGVVPRAQEKFTVPPCITQDVTKDTKKHAQGRVAQGEVCRKGRGAPVFSPVRHSPSTCTCPPTGNLSGPPYFWGFRGGFMTEARSITKPTYSPASPSGGWGWKAEFQASQHALVFVLARPSAGTHQGWPLQNRRRSCHSEKNKGFRNWYQEPGSDGKR